MITVFQKKRKKILFSETNTIKDNVSQVKLKHMSTILLKSHAAEKKKGKKSIMIPIIGTTNIQQEWFMK